MVDSVRQALSDHGIHGMTILEAKGTGGQEGPTEVYRGSECHINFLPKVKVEVAVADSLAETVIECIVKAARTGEVGDGKIFVTNVEEVIRVRTQEVGESAL